MKFEKVFINVEFKRLTCPFIGKLVKDPCQVKSTDGFIYSINISFCITPDMAFVRGRIFNSKPVLSKGNLVLTIFMKTRMCSSIRNKVLLIYENQVNARGAVFTNKSRFIY